MFGNLIESRSHTSEFARRGYFIVGTMACYGVLLMAGIVGSVYAYDAHLETQDLEVVALINPQTPVTIIEKHQNMPKPANQKPVLESQRQVLVAQIANNTKPPTDISTKPNTVPEMPPGPVAIGPRNIDANVVLSGPGTGTGSNNNPEPTRPIVIDNTPAPEPVKPEVKQHLVISKGPVTGQAISLPKPAYPPMAQAAHVVGAVRIQVLIDETGKVVSASVLDGHPLLRQEALRVAWQARFKPTTLSDVPVKVSGYIVYNFTRG
ncbi:MAG: TonB family protein [Pyrinomonadaceae bacterium]